MELKDVILSTLAEMEDSAPLEVEQTKQVLKKTQVIKPTVKIKEEVNEVNVDNEIVFLTSMRERLLVLFEGFQAPNNTNIEAKIDMTLNFLEYMLANIDNRVDEIQKDKSE